MKLKDICDEKMSLNDCEIEIIRRAVDNIQENQDRETVNNPEIKKMISILEKFLKKKKLICYGGTAINNLLPKEAQFYDYDIEIPDYDFFSPTPVKHAKELANIYLSEGFDEVEAKAGVHHGTYKVFVNFIPIADITYQPSKLFKTIKKTSIVKEGIYYAPPNLLKMSMYLELSRPKGDVSRWEKVAKRSQLLNKYYPLLPGNLKCNKIKVHKELIPNISSMEFKSEEEKTTFERSIQDQKDIFVDLIKYANKEESVFFGGFANKLYANFTKTQKQEELLEIPDFDILHLEPEKFINNLIKFLKTKNKNFTYKIIKHDKIGEIIATHYELKINNNSILFVYEPLACHSYNTIKMNFKNYGKVNMNIASIDTMLSFYLAFLFSEREYYNKDRILCMCNVLFNIQKKNRFSQKKLLKRFGPDCYGTQETKTTIRQEKANMFKKLQNKRNSHLYEEWFLNYKPYDFPLSVREKIKKTPSYVMSIKKYSKLKYKKEQPQYKEEQEQEKDTKKEEGNFILNIFNKEHNETSNKNNKTKKKKKGEKKSLISILKKNKTKKNKSVKFNI